MESADQLSHDAHSLKPSYHHLLWVTGTPVLAGIIFWFLTPMHNFIPVIILQLVVLGILSFQLRTHRRLILISTMFYAMLLVRELVLGWVSLGYLGDIALPLSKWGPFLKFHGGINSIGADQYILALTLIPILLIAIPLTLLLIVFHLRSRRNLLQHAIVESTQFTEDASVAAKFLLVGLALFWLPFAWWLGQYGYPIPQDFIYSGYERTMQHSTHNFSGAILFCLVTSIPLLITALNLRSSWGRTWVPRCVVYQQLLFTFIGEFVVFTYQYQGRGDPLPFRETYALTQLILSSVTIAVLCMLDRSVPTNPQ
ncbi:MAG TPA: hypothetical protein VGM23_11420 [Armatimonadota bacterium]|jgi:hypothetical protein